MRKKNTTTEMMKQYISESLLILMSEKHYADISIGEITAKAGVNRSTYYRNFNSKEEIIKFYFQSILKSFLELIDNKETVTLNEYLYKMYAQFIQYKIELLRIYRDGISYLILETLNEIFLKNHKKYTFEKQYKIYYHTGGIYNIFLLWFNNDMQTSPEQMTELAVSILPDDFKPMLLVSN